MGCISIFRRLPQEEGDCANYDDHKAHPKQNGSPVGLSVRLREQAGSIRPWRDCSLCDPLCPLWSKGFINHRGHRGITEEGSSYSPPTVRPSMRMVGEATAPRNSRSLAISEIFRNISFKLPPTVISSTGKASSPPEIHKPDAPRE